MSTVQYKTEGVQLGLRAQPLCLSDSIGGWGTRLGDLKPAGDINYSAVTMPTLHLPFVAFRFLILSSSEPRCIYLYFFCFLIVNN